MNQYLNESATKEIEKDMNTNELETMAITENTGFSAPADMGFLLDGFCEECAGMTFRPERVKMPTGGNTAFRMPDDGSGAPEPREQLDCVILLSHPANTYYAESYKGQRNRPDCWSQDGVRGSGGMLCRECPHNQYGSGGGNAKACKSRRMLYILLENQLFPMTLNLPGGSLQSFGRYVQSLLGSGLRPNQVVTRISLRKITSPSGVDYAQAVFRCLRPLTEAEKRNMAEMARQVRALAAGLNSAPMPAEEPEAGMVDMETGEILRPLT